MTAYGGASILKRKNTDSKREHRAGGAFVHRLRKLSAWPEGFRVRPTETTSTYSRSVLGALPTYGLRAQRARGLPAEVRKEQEVRVGCGRHEAGRTRRRRYPTQL